jgi:hypothetical protein
MRISIITLCVVFYSKAVLSIFCAFKMLVEWAAQHGRVLLTHDVATMITFAYQRIEAELAMTGLFEVSRRVAIGLAIEEIILIAECSLEGEWEGQVRFLPLR